MCRQTVLAGSMTLAYFAAVSSAVFVLARARRSRRKGRLIAFSSLMIACLVVPAQWPTPGANQIAVLIGWEVMLGGYSYYVEHTSHAPRWSDCIFFLLVNPTLVYPDSGTMDPSPSRFLRAAFRAGLGVLAWVTQDAISAVAASYGFGTAPLSVESIETYGYAYFVGTGVLALVSYYFAHSGLASLRIGLMSLAGYRIHECYRFPILARNPQDFWRRWNIWTGAWLRRYIFFPLSIRIGRRFGIKRSSTVAAVMLTFTTVGVLHDCTKYVLTLDQPFRAWPPPKGVFLFLLFGLVLIAWKAAGDLYGRRRDGSSPKSMPPFELMIASICVAALMQSHILVYGASLWAVHQWRLWW